MLIITILLFFQLSQKTVAVSCDRPSKGPFVYGFVDLFIGSGESWHWGLSVEESNNTSSTVDNLQNGSQLSWEKVNQNMKMGVVEDAKLDKVLSSTGKVDTPEEESESTDSFTSQSEELVEDVSIGEVRSHEVLLFVGIKCFVGINFLCKIITFKSLMQNETGLSSARGY